MPPKAPKHDKSAAAEAGIVKDARMLFVRGVATAVDETALSECFSALGPISQCFLVREKGADDHKGIGFVQFALPEDAERALSEMNGTALKGRTLKVITHPPPSCMLASTHEPYARLCAYGAHGHVLSCPAALPAANQDGCLCLQPCAVRQSHFA